jgi:hypothetical protein
LKHYKVMTREDLIKKTFHYVDSLPKIVPSIEDVDLCKSLHNNRMKNSKIYDSKHPLSPTNKNKISRNHADGDLWWGLLGELEIARTYGDNFTASKWYEDQIRQNNKVLSTGQYDCRDIGHTQVRAAEWFYSSPRRLIYRDNDFRTKSCQPVISCVVYTNPLNYWVVVCGFMSWEDLKARKQEFWGDPDNRGYYAMWIPFWELTPMAKFNQKWLL